VQSLVHFVFCFTQIQTYKEWLVRDPQLESICCSSSFLSSDNKPSIESLFRDQNSEIVHKISKEIPKMVED